MKKPLDPFLRSVGGVLLGYVALATVTVFTQFAIAATLSSDDLFEPDRFAPKPLFVALQLGSTFVAALLAGWLCRRIGLTRKPAYVLLAIVLIFEIFHALFSLMATSTPVARTGTETPEAVQSAQRAERPLALVLGVPGALGAGIMIGSSRRRFKS